MSNLVQLLRDNDSSVERLTLTEPRDVLRSPSFDDFLVSLQNNTSVRTFYVAELVVQMMSEEQLCRLVQAMGLMPSLEAVEIAIPFVNERKCISAVALSHLLQSQSLKTVMLWPNVLFSNQEELDLVSDTLRGHESLTRLHFMNLLLASTNFREGNEARTTTISMDPFLEVLMTVPNLDMVQLSAGVRVSSGSQSPLSPQSLRRFLQGASRLESLALRNLGLTNDHCHQIVEFLQQHNEPTSQRAIKFLDVRFNSINEPGFRALRDVLQCNYTLEWLETDLVEKIVLKEMEFLLLLNRAGRYIMLKDANATRDQCVQVLSRTEDNLDALFFLLRSAPAVCDHHAHT